jgi:hypothetical protein
MTIREFLFLTCNHSEIHMRMQKVKDVQTISTRTPAATMTSAEKQVGLAKMTRDIRVSRQIVSNVPMQCANMLTVAARSAPAATQEQQHNGQKCPDCPDISGA